MTHYANNTKGQKKYLWECGYDMKHLNKLNKKQLYALYRKEEKKKKLSKLFGL